MFKTRSLDEEQNWPYLCLIFRASSVLYWICNKMRVTPWECVSAEEFHHRIHVVVKGTFSSLAEDTCHGQQPPACSQTCAVTLKSQGRSLLSRQWENEGIQWLLFLLNTGWSKQPSSGKLKFWSCFSLPFAARQESWWSKEELLQPCTFYFFQQKLP